MRIVLLSCLVALFACDRGEPAPESPAKAEPEKAEPAPPAAAAPAVEEEPAPTTTAPPPESAEDPDAPAAPEPEPSTEPDRPEPIAAPAAKERSCLEGSDCASGICEGQGCGPKKPGRCVPPGRTCTTDAVVYCGCDHQTFRSSSQCPGRRYRNRGDCHR